MRTRQNDAESGRVREFIMSKTGRDILLCGALVLFLIVGVVVMWS